MYSCVQDGEQLHYRIRLDRRRFESAHLKYAMLMIQNRYPGSATSPVAMTAYVMHTLQKFTPAFYDAFCEKYSGTYHERWWCMSA